jgi:hypothetical protein
MSKLTLAVAFAAGYVVGAKAGRDRYEQIRAGAQKVAENPKVQAATGAAKEKAGEVAATVAETAKEKAVDAASAAKEKVSNQAEQPGGPISAAP